MMMSRGHLARFETAHFFPRQQRSQWHATAQSFAEHDDIRLDAVGLFGKQSAAATDTGLHFVEDQQNAELSTEPLDAFEVIRGGGNDASIALDRFEHDCHGSLIHRRVQCRKVIERDMADRRRSRRQTKSTTIIAGHDNSRSTTAMCLTPITRQFDRRLAGFAT
ncbi:hypothetical protein D3C85_1243540 [compost metagenome]